jgi:hypothetical protein
MLVEVEGMHRSVVEEDTLVVGNSLLAVDTVVVVLADLGLKRKC